MSTMSEQIQELRGELALKNQKIKEVEEKFNSEIDSLKNKLGLANDVIRATKTLIELETLLGIQNLFLESEKMAADSVYDCQGEEIKEGDHVSFSYGIPPVGVRAKVVSVNGELWILTPGHKPGKSRLSGLEENVGDFFKSNSVDQTGG